MTKAKTKLEIDPLKTINDFLEGFDYFTITNSTPRRNLAHLLQLRQFLIEIEKSYLIEKSLLINYKYNLLRVESDIIETALFCALEQIGKRKLKGKSKATGLISAAKKNRLITKQLAKSAQIIVDYRNDLHPDKQMFLLVKANPKLFILSEQVIERLFMELKNYFRPIKTENRCEYCEYGLASIGDFCYACGNYNYGI